MELIKPKEVTVKGLDGIEKRFKVSRVPAIMGREIFTQYAVTAAPKVGDYGKNKELLMKMLQYVEAESQGSFIRLEHESLVDNHVTDFEMLLKLEYEMLKYNTDFFSPARLSGSLGSMIRGLPQLIMKILTQLSALSSVREEPPSKS